MKFDLNINVFKNAEAEIPIPLVLADFEQSDDLKEVSDAVFTIINQAADADSCVGFHFLENDDTQINGRYNAESNTCQIFFFNEVSGQPILQTAAVFSIECLTHVNVVLFSENVDDVRSLISAIIKTTPLCYMQMIEKFKGVANDD